VTQDLQGRVAIVTGGSRGIGRAIALHLAAGGATVVLDYIADEEQAAATLAELRHHSPASLAVAADVRSTPQMTALVDGVLRDFGRVDILVNNAGIARDGFFHRQDEKSWDDVMDVDLDGVARATRLVLPHMRKARWGRIISISSIIGFTGNLGQANYAAAKAAVVGFTKSLALENAALGITVNAIAPGFIHTAMVDAIPAPIRERTLRQIPVGRFGRPEEIACMVGYLVSPAAAYITGQTIHINGGLYL
jgi:3-oxoacyl-[acyl-carrier protein] reductase